MATQGTVLPDYVRREFADYLKCGWLKHGFLRVRYDSCHAKHLVDGFQELRWQQPLNHDYPKKTKMPQLITRDEPAPRNFLYYWTGLAVLVLNKIRHSVQGYTTPRTFPIEEGERAIEYDFSVVQHWLDIYQEYTGESADLRGKTILELGPGADLGIGLITLWKGARKYNSLDVHSLVDTVPDHFYESLFQTMAGRSGEGVLTVNELRHQLKLTQAGKNDRLNYVCRPDFDIRTFKTQGVDLVFSQAAFEHFDDIDRTFAQLSTTVKSGAILIAEIDLNTHTRWLRDVDPLNIYRYSETTYKLFKFRGSPNRIRPGQYKAALEKLGWADVRVMPLTRVNEAYLSGVRSKLSSRFREAASQIEFVSVMLCARKR